MEGAIFHRVMDFFQVLFLNLKSIFHRFLIAPKKAVVSACILSSGPELLNLLLQLNYVDCIVIIPLHTQLRVPVVYVSHPYYGPTFSFNFCLFLRDKNFAMWRGIIVVYPLLESSMKWLT